MIIPKGFIYVENAGVINGTDGLQDRWINVADISYITLDCVDCVYIVMENGTEFEVVGDMMPERILQMISESDTDRVIGNAESNDD